MPNWCSNRMYFSGEPAQIAEIKRLASGAVTPFYRRATNEGIQLFLAGSAGLLQTTEDVQFEPCPGLTAAGRGVVSPENIAFTTRCGFGAAPAFVCGRPVTGAARPDGGRM